MYEKELNELKFISQAVGNSPDLVQGGGGNTSVKLSAELMAVKASGFQLKQITQNEGYVVVNYLNIKNYYENVDLKKDTDFEKESVEFVKNNVIEMEGLKKLRPSVEAGFHSILKKYVIHTHPVYANILCCSVEGNELAKKIFTNKEYGFLWIPYINPGFNLTLKIKEGIDNYKGSGKIPEVIFMQNHGLVVNADNYERCTQLHTQVNRLIKEHFDNLLEFPKIELDKVSDDEYISKTGYLSDWVKSGKLSNEYFDKISLYPDQLVYLNDSVSVDGPENKLNINSKKGKVVYKTNMQEALTIEETLLAYLYVVDMVDKCGLTIQTMTKEEIGFIKGWESEKYRKSLLKK